MCDVYDGNKYFAFNFDNFRYIVEITDDTERYACNIVAKYNNTTHKVSPFYNGIYFNIREDVSISNIDIDFEFQ